MGKQGPCCHCGITSTPLWRNGPPEKPVLCNACGSRWRTKGTLANYTPIHARAFTPLDFGDLKNYREDKLPASAKSKSWSMKVHNDCKIEDGHSFAAHHPYQTSFEDDTSNKSSSGSAISVSESCVQFGSTDGNEISGPYQASLCDFQIPSKKRTRIRRHSPSPVEKLRQDLVSILQQQDSSYLSEFSEEVLLFEGEDISFDSEIGHGSVLLKPSISSKEEESEASSHVIGNKISCLSEAYMGSSCCSLQSQNNEISSGPSGKDQLSQVIWDINELKEDQAKECASTYRSLEGTVSEDPYVLQSKSSSQTSINEKLLNSGKTNSAKEAPSFTTGVTGNGVSVLTKRPRDSPYFHTYEGKGSGTMCTFKRPRERSHVEMLTSGEESVHIQASSLITKSVPPLPASVVSDVNSSLSTVQVENYFEPS